MSRHNRDRRRSRSGSRQDLLRRLLARFTHEAVCEASGTDGRGHCLWYSAFGWVFAQSVFRRPYYVQAGNIGLKPDPNDPDLEVGLLADDDGLLCGEYHTWLGSPLDADRFEIVDLSSRHYPFLVEGLPQVLERRRVGDFVATIGTPSVARWRRPAPPEALWLTIEAGRWPLDWLYLKAAEKHCQAIQRPAADLLEQHELLVKAYLRRLMHALE
jgi:hypothetical protein